jgi:hypothetical protein
MAARQMIYGDDVLTPEPEPEAEEDIAAEPATAADTSKAEADALFRPQPGAGE